MRFLQDEPALGKVLSYWTLKKKINKHFSLASDISVLDNFKAGNRTNCVHTQETSPSKKVGVWFSV